MILMAFCEVPDADTPRDYDYKVMASITYLSSLIYFQVRTLFVSGLPMDAKPRELYLLFRAYEVSERSGPRPGTEQKRGADN